MRLGSCAYADEVAAMLRRGQWPDGCGGELRAHVDGCSRCTEQVLVAQSFQQARTEAVQEARVGSASLLWWRAQFRQRNAALERVSRPMTLAQIFALLIGVAAVVGLFVSQMLSGEGWLSWLFVPESSTTLGSDLLTLFASMNADGSLMLLAGGVVAAVLLGGVVYLASDTQ